MAPSAHGGILCLLLVPMLVRAQLCEFTCPNGTPLAPRMDFAPSTNGCGVSGLKIKSAFDFTECCNEHDLVRGPWARMAATVAAGDGRASSRADGPLAVLPAVWSLVRDV